MRRTDTLRRVGLAPRALVELTRSIAEEVRDGRQPAPGFNVERRWHRRLHRDDVMDVWLIGWLPSQGTRLHDHGGSAGAFTVVSGELSEATYVEPSRGAGRLRERPRGVGASVGFHDEYVHDIRNLSNGPAASVHAYSPPLEMMRFYEVRDGRLVIVGALETDDPEPVIPRSLVT